MPSKHITTALFAAAILLTWHSALSAEVEIHENALRSITRRMSEGLEEINVGNDYYKGFLNWNITNENSATETGLFTCEIYIEKTAASSKAISGTLTVTEKFDGETVYSGSYRYSFPANCAIGTRAYLGSGKKTVELSLCVGRMTTFNPTISSDSNFSPMMSYSQTKVNGISVNTIVTYNAMGGTVSPSTTISDCGIYENLAEPTREGYSFDGWYTAANGGTKITEYYTSYNYDPHTIYAHWTINSYTVEFIDDDVTVKEETLTYNSNINFPEENPKKEGYTFAYWCENETIGEEYTGTTVPAYNLTLYPKFTPNKYTVTFECAEGISCPPITDDFMASIADFVPKREGYTFAGWYIDEGLETEYTETTIPAKNITLYPKFDINKYTVTFECAEGISCPPITEDYKSTITLPSPEREGYTFAGWYIDEESETEYTETTIPAKNITLYPKFDINNYTIKFVDEDTTIEEETLPYNTTISYPAETPKREGYTFAGWHIDEEPETEYTETTIPAKNITLYPKFTINYYTIKFVSEDGTVKEEVVPYNTTISYPAENPKKEGYAFNGWDSKPERVGAENVTIRAVWVEITNEYVEIVFGKGGMREEDIKAIINKYAPEGSYKIEKFEENDEGKITVIIKFKDGSEVEAFSRKIIVSENDNIDSVKYNSKSTSSLAGGLLYPLSLFALVFP